MSQTIEIRRRAYSSIPDDVLTNDRLSWAARVVLGWMIGRSAEFVLHVWYVRKVFRLSETQWVRVRRELEAAGYYRAERRHGDGGKMEWKHWVTDTPEDIQPSPQKPGDGVPWDGKPSDGRPSGGEQRDKPLGSRTKRSITKEPQLPPQPPEHVAVIRPECGCGDGGEELVIEPIIAPYYDELIAALRQGGIRDSKIIQDMLDELAGTLEAGNRGERQKIGNPVRWLKALISGQFVRARCHDIQNRRRARIEAEMRRQQAERPVEIDQEARTRGEAILAGLRKRRECQAHT